MSIGFERGVFRLNTENTSYIFKITDFSHLEHIHYGERLEENEDVEPLCLKRTALIGSSVLYSESDTTYCLDTIPLEWSGIGRGDYRHTPAELKMPDGSFVCDFRYRSHEIFKGGIPPVSLPAAYGEKEACDTLILTLADDESGAELLLYYTVFSKCDVITRRCVLKNTCENPIIIRKLMSLMVDLPNRNFRMVTFDGGWIKEAHRHDRALQYGIFVTDSTTGASSNRHNPGFLLAEEGAGEENGRVYGFNLVYSGNHYGAVELSGQDLVRVMTGINPHCFEWPLKKDESFETPEAVMTFSDKGFGGLSRGFHDFINNHIVRGEWKNKERPVLINSWEGCFFDFDERRLLSLARRAKRLGAELFVLDDGWFGKRDSDKSGLGDYAVNKKKLPHGLSGLAGRLSRIGLSFGLWFEPEGINPDSELFRAHPEYAIRIPGRRPVMGRHQLTLDLCRKEVRDYIVGSVSSVLDSAKISYVKWDMNRHLSDFYSPGLKNQGEFFHRYTLGLYEVLGRIFSARPHILLESCASGGGRFDLGMLCFSPQIWCSDNTDPVERLKIQGGLSHLYPPSTMGAHVSASPHQQTLRATPLSTRFHAACFGCLGYELDLKYLSPLEKKEIRRQIAFYKEHRAVFQFGRFYRAGVYKENKVCFQSVAKDKSAAFAGFFQTLAGASEGFDFLPLSGLDPQTLYTVGTRPQGLKISRFGGLIHHVLPIKLNPEGVIMRTAGKYYALPDCVEEYRGSGRLLSAGIKLNTQFSGSHYNNKTRLLGDFGSNLYIIEKAV